METDKKFYTRGEYESLKEKAFKKNNAPHNHIDKDNYYDMIGYMPTELMYAVIENRVQLEFGYWSPWFMQACREELAERMLLGKD